MEASEEIKALFPYQVDDEVMLLNNQLTDGARLRCISRAIDSSVTTSNSMMSLCEDPNIYNHKKDMIINLTLDWNTPSKEDIYLELKVPGSNGNTFNYELGITKMCSSSIDKTYECSMNGNFFISNELVRFIDIKTLSTYTIGQKSYSNVYVIDKEDMRDNCEDEDCAFVDRLVYDLELGFIQFVMSDGDTLNIHE